MIIMCPDAFHEAVQFALEVDRRVESMIEYGSGDDEKARRKLEGIRGRASRTLLECFGHRAQADFMDSKDPHFPPDSEVIMPNGAVRTVLDLRKDELPVQETFITRDIAPYSFFFIEELVTPGTRQRVEVHDRCWYIFPKAFPQDRVDLMSDEELDGCITDPSINARRVFSQELAEREMAASGSSVVREAMKRRIKMCGGIIYHPDYDGKGGKTNYGSWSTHT